MEELKLEIFGRVQGVRFRHFVKETADSLKINGYVTNHTDGTVLVIAQKNREDLEKFLSIIQKGSLFSKIRRLSYSWCKPSQKLDDFKIKIDNSFIIDQTSSFLNLGKHILNKNINPPRHIAIIPDGNRRWAKEKGLLETEGHVRAIRYEHIYSIFEESRKLGVEYLTFWLFSTENWKRDKKEISNLFLLMTRFLKKFEKDALKNKVRFRHIGRRDRIPEKLLKAIISLEEKTKEFKEFNLQLAIDYGGRDEILRAVNEMITRGTKSVSEEDFMKCLDTRDLPDPDMIIRTSGEYRLSGFMPVQGTYSEFYFTSMHFPDFGPKELRTAVSSYYERQRRRGR